MKNSRLKLFNANKWGKDCPDCAIRSIVAALGFDYEVACNKLGVSCTPGVGYTDEYGVDLDQVYEKFSKYFEPIQDNLEMFDDPVQSLIAGQTLNDWLDEHAFDNAKYVVYLDDNKENDGGHIVYANCTKLGSPTFMDTSDCGSMFVQAWMKVKAVVPSSSKLHWKFENGKFV